VVEGEVGAGREEGCWTVVGDVVVVEVGGGRWLVLGAAAGVVVVGVGGLFWAGVGAGVL